MTYIEAIALHLRHVNRQPVDPVALAEAIRIIAETRRKRTDELQEGDECHS